MGSPFDTLFGRAAVPVFMAVSGETVVYTPKGESEGTTIKALVNRGEGAADETSTDGVTLRLASEITVKTADCPTLLVGDQFRIDNLDYALSDVPHRTPSTATVTLRRIVHTEKSDGGVRKQRR